MRPAPLILVGSLLALGLAACGGDNSVATQPKTNQPINVVVTCPGATARTVTP